MDGIYSFFNCFSLAKEIYCLYLLFFLSSHDLQSKMYFAITNINSYFHNIKTCFSLFFSRYFAFLYET